MLQYRNFEFNGKEDFVDYIEERIVDYWKNHNDNFSRVCEDLDSWNGFLGNDRLYQMCDLDDLLGEKKPSEVLQMLDSDFNYDLDDYFYFDGCGKLCSTDEKEYFNSVSYSEVFEQLIDDYVNVFSEDYGCAYYNLFGDVYDIMNSYTESEIQELMDNDYYEHLFEDDENFFLSMLEKLNLSDLLDDDLDE